MKIFSKETKIGLTVIIAFTLLIYGINFLKGVNLFQKSNLYYVSFHNINGLAESNPIYAANTCSEPILFSPITYTSNEPRVPERACATICLILEQPSNRILLTLSGVE